MQLLKDMIKTRGEVCEGGILKVGSFFNQQIDMTLAREMGNEFAKLFKDCGITKILTIEASGIIMAYSAAQALNVPMVFAKKGHSLNVNGNVYSSNVVSYTRGKTYTIQVPCEFISSDDVILIIDDFLATGNALLGLIGVVNAAGATVAGVGIGIEKAFQNGGDKIRGLGVRVESLARIQSMNPEDGVIFCD